MPGRFGSSREPSQVKLAFTSTNRPNIPNGQPSSWHCRSATKRGLNLMKTAQQVVFRRLTSADFFNINKQKGAEPRGGGQSYIDFPISSVRLEDWMSFFSGQGLIETDSGPLWRFAVNSLGLNKSQEAEIQGRLGTNQKVRNVSLRKQKLGTSKSNRLYAWHPEYSGFPFPADPSVRATVPNNLVVYLIRTADGEYWAGFFQTSEPRTDWQVDDRLRQMFTEKNGSISLDPGVYFDEQNPVWPFLILRAAIPIGTLPVTVKPARKTSDEPQGLSPVRPAIKQPFPRSNSKNKQLPHYKSKSDAEITAELFGDDIVDEPHANKRKITVTVLQRNQKIVAALKSLYGGHCQ